VAGELIRGSGDVACSQRLSLCTRSST